MYTGVSLRLRGSVNDSVQTFTVDPPLQDNHLKTADPTNPDFETPIALEANDVSKEIVVVTSITPGSDLTTNGGFASDTGWTKGTGWTISGGAALKTAGTASDIEQNQAVSNGTKYLVRYRIRNMTAGTIFARLGGTAGTSRTTGGRFYEYVTAGAGGEPKLEFVADSAFDGELDDVAVVEEYTLTVLRGQHGPDAAAHSDNAELRGIVCSVSMMSVTLTGVLPGAFPPVTSPLAVGELDQNRVSWAWSGTAQQANALTKFRVYWDTTENGSSPASWPVDQVEEVSAGVRQWVHQPGDHQLYYYRISAVGGGVESALSAAVNATPLAAVGPPEAPTVPATPDAPTVTAAPQGAEIFSVFGIYHILITVIYSSSTGRGGTSKTHLQVADANATHNVSSGFSAALFDSETSTKPFPAPPVEYVFTTGNAGLYQISARLYNRLTAAWSDFSAPIKVNTRSGELSYDVPGAPSFLVIDDPTSEDIGNRVVVRCGPPSSNAAGVYAYEVQALEAAFDPGVGNSAVLQNSNTRGMLVAVSDGTADLGKATITADVDPSWTTDEWAGEHIWTYYPGATFPAFRRPMAWDVKSNTGDTVTIESISAPPAAGVFPAGAFDAASAETASIKFFIVDGFAREGTELDLWDEFVMVVDVGKPNEGRLESEYTIKYLVSSTLYWRVRWKSRHGYGPWIYWDGSNGSTNIASAVQFAPGQIQTPAIGDQQVTGSKVLDNTLDGTQKIIAASVKGAALARAGQRVNIPTSLFSPLDHDTVQWGTDLVSFQDGTSSFNPLAGNTGNMGGSTYVYHDGTTTLKTTPSVAIATGDSNTLLAACRPAPTSDQDASYITPSSMSINADYISARAIAAVMIQVDALTGYLVQGDTIATALTGRRVELTSVGGVELINSSGATLMQLKIDSDDNVGNIVFATGASQAQRGEIEWGTAYKIWANSSQLSLISEQADGVFYIGSTAANTDGFGSITLNAIDATGSGIKLEVERAFSSAFIRAVADATDKRVELSQMARMISSVGNCNLGDVSNKWGELWALGGVVIGSPTGGNKGGGLVNAQGYYVNDILLVNENRLLTGGNGINTIGDLSADRTISIDQSFTPTWSGNHRFDGNIIVGDGDFTVPTSGQGMSFYGSGDGLFYVGTSTANTDGWNSIILNAIDSTSAVVKFEVERSFSSAFVRIIADATNKRVELSQMTSLSLQNGCDLDLSAGGRVNFVDTSASATSGARTLPANFENYIVIEVGGSDKKIPYYAV